MSRLNHQPSQAERIQALEKEVKELRSLLVSRTGRILRGAGDPEGAKVAPVGTIYLRTDSATTLYVKQTGSGATGWVAK